MLSERLEALASHFRAWALRPRPVALDQRVAALIHTELAEAAEAARHIEGTPVPPPARGDLPDGVADFCEAHAARRVA